MQNCCLKYKIGDIQSVKDKVTDHITVNKAKYRPACPDLFLFIDDPVIRFSKFLFQMISDFRMKPQLFGIVV